MFQLLKLVFVEFDWLHYCMLQTVYCSFILVPCIQNEVNLKHFLVRSLSQFLDNDRRYSFLMMVFFVVYLDRLWLDCIPELGVHVVEEFHSIDVPINFYLLSICLFHLLLHFLQGCSFRWFIGLIPKHRSLILWFDWICWSIRCT